MGFFFVGVVALGPLLCIQLLNIALVSVTSLLIYRLHNGSIYVQEHCRFGCERAIMLACPCIVSLIDVNTGACLAGSGQLQVNL